MVLYAMIVQENPYYELSLEEMYKRVEKGERPKVPEERVKFNENLVSVFERCIVLDPNERPAAEGIVQTISCFVKDGA